MALSNPNPTAVEEQLGRIFASSQFRQSPRLQTFLRFVISLTLEGKAQQIKESSIASEVFGRVEMADDSIVRSAARRLRERLEEYYLQSGRNDPVRITIPKGSYVPEIHELHVKAEPPEPANEPQPTPATTPEAIPAGKRRHAWWIVLASVVLITVLATAAMRSLDRQPAYVPNAEAQELYLKGRYYWSKRTPQDLNRAVDYFTQAVVKDPRDAQAYAGLADSYNLLSEYTSMPYKEAFRRALAAAKTAIQLDPSLPEAHNSLAFASFYGAWDAASAEREFRRALQLNPNYTTAHHWYATFLSAIGRQREALREIERAQKLDPSSKSILADKGQILIGAGQIAVAQVLLEDLEASDPDFLSPHRYLAQLYLLEKRYPDYLRESRKVALLSDDTSQLAVVEAGEKGLAGRDPKRMLTRMLAAQQSVSNGQGARDYPLAQIYAMLGDPGSAIQSLQSSYAQRDIRMLAVAVDPCFASMHGDPAFRKLVRQIGVAQ